MKKTRLKLLIPSLVAVIALVCAAVMLIRPVNVLLANAGLADQAVGYNSQAVHAVEVSEATVIESQGADRPVVPASIAKLFVIDYAAQVLSPDEQVEFGPQVLALVKPGSSLANLPPGRYPARTIYAAMMVPSGNDAAYALADIVTRKRIPSSADMSPEQRHALFLSDLDHYLHEQGYGGTEIHDAAGYDSTARTTAADVASVTRHLLSYDWFRQIVAQHVYSAPLPSGGSLSWINTNLFLDPESDFFNPAVAGVKTGSFGDTYNLVVLYRSGGKEFVVVCLGAQSTTGRYDDAGYLLQQIDEMNQPSDTGS